MMTFPEGGRGTGPGYARRYRLERLGRGGFVELALRSGAPIVPCARRRPAGPGPSTALLARVARLPRPPLRAARAAGARALADRVRRAAARRPPRARAPPRTARSCSSWPRRCSRACRRRCTTASSIERERCDVCGVQLAQGVPGGHGPDLRDDGHRPRDGAQAARGRRPAALRVLRRRHGREHPRRRRRRGAATCTGSGPTTSTGSPRSG